MHYLDDRVKRIEDKLEAEEELREVLNPVKQDNELGSREEDQ